MVQDATAKPNPTKGGALSASTLKGEGTSPDAREGEKEKGGDRGD